MSQRDSSSKCPFERVEPGCKLVAVTSEILRMRGSTTFLTVLFLALICPLSRAHRPIFSDRAAKDADTAVMIAEPAVSQVIYREITDKTPQVWLVLDAEAGFELFIQIGVPVLDRLKSFRPAMLVIGPGLPEKPLPIPVPKGSGARNFTTDNVKDPRFFHEHFTGTDSWILRSEIVAMPRTGRYYVVAYVPSKQPGKLWLSVGSEEVFGPADLAEFGEWKKRIREFHEVGEQRRDPKSPFLRKLRRLLQTDSKEPAGKYEHDTAVQR